MKQKTYTACIIGVGRIGFSLGFDKKREQPASHTMALKANRRIKIVAGCDQDEKKLSEWAKFTGVDLIFSDCEKLFANCKADIVVVAVNEDSHLSVTLQAIRSKPRLIILEKPVALNVEQALELQEEAKKYSVPILVNHERRFALDYSLARSYIKKIGDIQSVNARLCSSLRVYSEKDEKTGSYSLLHDGTHLVDIVLYLLESEKNLDSDYNFDNGLHLSGLTGVHFDLSEVSENLQLTTSNKNANAMSVERQQRTEYFIVRNFNAHYKSSSESCNERYYRSNFSNFAKLIACDDINFSISGRSKFFSFEVEILGTLGKICIGNGYANFYVRKQSKLYTGFYSLEKDKSVKIPKKTKYFSEMVQNAVDFLDGKEKLKSTVQDGINCLKVLEEIKEQLKAEILQVAQNIHS